jgi:hypothetical protein
MTTFEFENEFKIIMEEYHNKYLEYLEKIKAELDGIREDIDKINHFKSNKLIISEIDNDQISMVDSEHASLSEEKYNDDLSFDNNDDNLKIKENYYNKYNKDNTLRFFRRSESYKNKIEYFNDFYEQL